MGAPLWLRRLVSLRAIDRTIGRPRRHGLTEPDHRLWETHPVINSELYERIDAGALGVAGDVAAFDGDTVVFTDGHREAFDVVICATGYRVALPFIDTRLLGADEPDGLAALDRERDVADGRHALSADGEVGGQVPDIEKRHGSWADANGVRASRTVPQDGAPERRRYP